LDATAKVNDSIAYKENLFPPRTQTILIIKQLSHSPFTHFSTLSRAQYNR
jgi:hypothetical protein